MRNFDPEAYGERCARLLDGDRLCPLDAGVPNRAVFEQLNSLSNDELGGGCRLLDDQMAQACRAGLWLLHNYLDHSHEISQELASTTGSYWHGIMHRREPDYSNAKYWFRRVGDHEVFPDLAMVAHGFSQSGSAAREFERLTTRSTWDPFAFIDLCEQAHAGEASSGPSALGDACRWLARSEWELLFDYCYRRAFGE